MELSKIFSICILSVLLIRLSHSNFTLDLYLFLKILLTLALYFYPFSTQTTSPSKNKSPLSKTSIPKTLDSNPPNPKKVSFSHLTDLPIKKLDFDRLENSPILLNSPIKMSENSSSPITNIKISLPQPKKKEKLYYVPQPKPSHPTTKEIMKKAKEKNEEIRKIYQDYAENVRFEYEQIIKNSKVEPEIIKPPTVHVKERFDMLPVILERNESELGFEFNPLEHKTGETKGNKGGKETIDDFDPKPLGSKMFALSGLEMQIKNLEKEENKSENLTPHMVLPVHRVKPFTTQLPILSSSTDFNPVPNDKNQVIQTSSVLGTEKSKQNNSNFFVDLGKSDSNLLKVNKPIGPLSSDGAMASHVILKNCTHNEMAKEVNQNHSFFVGGANGGNQTGNFSVNSVYSGNSERKGSNPFVNTNNFGGLGTQSGNPLCNSANMAGPGHQSTDPLANVTSYSTQTSQSINPFASTTNFSNQTSQPLNPFANPGLSNYSNPSSQSINLFTNASSFPTQNSQPINPFANATLPQALNSLANTSKISQQSNPFISDSSKSNPFNINPSTNLPQSSQYPSYIHQSKPISAPYTSLPVSNFSISSPASNHFTPTNHFNTSSHIPSAQLSSLTASNMYSTPPTIPNHLLAGNYSSQNPPTLKANPSFSNPPLGFQNSSLSSYNTTKKIDELTLDSYKSLRNQISTNESSQKLISEELLYNINTYYINITITEIDELYEKILSIFKQVPEIKLTTQTVSFTFLTVDYYLNNSNNDKNTVLSLAEFIVNLYSKLSLLIRGIQSILEFEIKTLSEIFSPKIYLEQEVTESWRLNDLRRTSEGGILQKQVLNEIKTIESLSILLSNHYIKHSPDDLFNLISQLSLNLPPRQWLPMIVGVMIILPFFKNTQIFHKISPLLNTHKAKLNLIPQVCNKIFFSSEISRFMESFNKIFGF